MVMRTNPEGLTVEHMIEQDLQEISDIEKTVFSEPWSENMFRKELNFPLSHCLVARTVLYGVVAYGVFWIVGDEAHIHHIAVRQDWRRRGAASALLQAMFKLARMKGVQKATLEVRPSNTAARQLYSKFNFILKGVRPSYYTDTGEDALIMWADWRENCDGA